MKWVVLVNNIGTNLYLNFEDVDKNVYYEY